MPQGQVVHDHVGIVDSRGGGRYIAESIAAVQLQKSAKRWVDEHHLYLSGAEFTDRGFPISRAERVCHAAMLHWLLYRFIQDSGLVSPVADCWVEGEDDIVEMLQEYRILDSDLEPTMALYWLFEWLDDGAPENVDSCFEVKYKGEWQSIKSGNRIKADHWAARTSRGLSRDAQYWRVT